MKPMKNELELITRQFAKLEKWSENEKRHIIKSSSLTVRNVTATIEHNDRLGYYLAYESPNLSYKAKSSPIITIEKQQDEFGMPMYVISTKTDTKDTIYYRLKI
jgi:hypothetical protein